MSFLEQNKRSRKNKVELSLGESPENEIIYFFTFVFYHARKNIGKVIIALLTIYLVYLRFVKTFNAIRTFFTNMVKNTLIKSLFVLKMKMLSHTK